MSNTFPSLPPATLKAANDLGQWLALDDFTSASHQPLIELVILAGNAVIPTIDAACRLARESDVPLLISGGIGHSTPFLYAAVRHDRRYHELPVEGRPEAPVLADIAHQFWHIPREKIVTEAHSTNCGENARFTRELLEATGGIPHSAVVVQDPTLQRRTMATFDRVWQNAAITPRWYSMPGYTPLLCNTDNGLAFCHNPGGLWPVERYLSLLLGELPRLQDTPQGYGPQGKDFIAHVTIPQNIIAAGEELMANNMLKTLLGR